MGKNCDLVFERFKNLSDSERNTIRQRVGKALREFDPEKALDDLRSDFLLETRMNALQKMQDSISVADTFDFVMRDTFTNPAEGLEALLDPISRTTRGASNSVSIAKREAKYITHRAFKEKIGEENIAFLTTADLNTQKTIAQAFDELSAGRPIENVSPKIREVVQGIQEYNSFLLKYQQDSGVLIRENHNFFASQSHDATQINRVKPDVWVNSIMDRLDPRATFGDIVDRDEQARILTSIWQDMASDGVEGAVGNALGSRVLQFKSLSDWVEYNAQFGKGDLYSSLHHSAESAANRAATAQIFGSANGRRNFEQVQQLASKAVARRGDPDQVAAFQKASSRINRLKNTVFSPPDTPRKWYGDLVENMRLINSMNLLGPQTVGTTMTDFAIQPMTLRSATGDSSIGIVNTVREFRDVVGTKGFKQYAPLARIETDNMLGEAFDRFGLGQAGKRGNAFLRKVNTKWLTMSGIIPQTQRAKAGAGRVMMGALGANKNVSFDSLNPRLRNSLERAEITAREWDVLRKSAIDNIEGADYISPDAILSAEGLTGRERTLLSGKVGRMGMDAALQGSPEGGARERALLMQGKSVDDPIGALGALVGQFSTFPLAMHRVIARALKNNPETNEATLMQSLMNGSNLKMMGVFAGQTTLIAAANMAIVQTLRGRSVDPTDPEFWGRATTRGAFPIYYGYMWDAITGEYNNNYRSLVEDLAGPSVRLADGSFILVGEAMGTIGRVYNGEENAFSPAAQAAFNMMTELMPGQNLPLITPLVRKTISTEIQELINPGYAERMKGRVERNPDRYLFDPYSTWWKGEQGSRGYFE